MNAVLVGARVDAREGVAGLRRLEAKLDRLAEAFDRAQRQHLGPHSNMPPDGGTANGSDARAATDVRSADAEQHRPTLTEDQRLEGLDRQLMLVAKAVGAPLLQRVSAGDDNEDRKRLKEKLKEALESDRRGRLRKIVSERQRWVEYLFGICQPDRRNGKRGNRWDELRDELLNQPYTCKCRISIRLGSAQTSIRWIDILLGAPEPSH